MTKVLPQIVRKFDISIEPKTSPWSLSTHWFVWQEYNSKVVTRAEVNEQDAFNLWYTQSRAPITSLSSLIPLSCKINVTFQQVLNIFHVLSRISRSLVNRIDCSQFRDTSKELKLLFGKSRIPRCMGHLRNTWDTNSMTTLPASSPTVCHIRLSVVTNTPKAASCLALSSYFKLN